MVHKYTYSGSIDPYSIKIGDKLVYYGHVRNDRSNVVNDGHEATVTEEPRYFLRVDGGKFDGWLVSVAWDSGTEQFDGSYCLADFGCKSGGGDITHDPKLYCSCENPLLKKNEVDGMDFYFCSRCRKERLKM
jgi:hypothetical protein